MGSNNDSADNLQNYLNRISHIALLSAEEEVRLAGKIAAGKEAACHLQSVVKLTPDRRQALKRRVRNGAAARKRLIKANTRLVIKTAFRHRERGLSLDDLIQEGNIGLVKAVDGFNHRLGFRFSTYAMYWIQNAMRQAIFEQGAGLRLPAHIRAQLRQLWQTEETLLADLRRNPTTGELAERMNWTEEEIIQLRQWARNPDSLDRPLSEDSDSLLADFVVDKRGQNPMEEVAKRLLHERLHEQLQSLDPLEASVLRLRYGLGEMPHTVEEAAIRLELSTYQVREVENKALRHMRSGALRQVFAGLA